MSRSNQLPSSTAPNPRACAGCKQKINSQKGEQSKHKITTHRRSRIARDSPEDVRNRIRRRRAKSCLPLRPCPLEDSVVNITAKGKKRGLSMSSTTAGTTTAGMGGRRTGVAGTEPAPSSRRRRSQSDHGLTD